MCKQRGTSCLREKCQHNDLGCPNINAILNINSADIQTAFNSSITRLISLPAPCQTRSVIRMPCFLGKKSVNHQEKTRKKKTGHTAQTTALQSSPKGRNYLQRSNPHVCLALSC